MTSPRVCVLTPTGRGAVATVRVEGDLRLLSARGDFSFRAANGRPLDEQTVGRVVFGHWGHPVAEDVVVGRLAENVVEIHCHGGSTAVRRILSDLERCGCAVETWPRQIERSEGSIASECRTALSHATTRRTADLLLEQYSGVLSSAFDEVARLADAWRRAGATATTERDELAARVGSLLAWSRFGLHLSTPWSIVLAGRPNAGKSSLINALVGYARSIVYDQPGTTRDVVTAETAFDGWPVQLADTAGIRATDDPLESAGVERARAQMESADCRVIVLDMSRPRSPDGDAILTKAGDAIIVAHKCDLPDAWGTALPSGAIRASSKTNAGIDDVIAAIVRRLVPKVPPAGTPVPVSARQVELLTNLQSAIQNNDAASVQKLVAESP